MSFKYLLQCTHKYEWNQASHLGIQNCRIKLSLNYHGNSSNLKDKKYFQDIFCLFSKCMQVCVYYSVISGSFISMKTKDSNVDSQEHIFTDLNFLSSLCIPLLKFTCLSWLSICHVPFGPTTSYLQEVSSSCWQVYLYSSWTLFPGSSIHISSPAACWASEDTDEYTFSATRIPLQGQTSADCEKIVRRRRRPD